jgi:cysteine-rich repeat protein
MRNFLLGALVLSIGCQLFIEASSDDLIEDTQERCLDQVDNDGDLLIDCQDLECAAFCATCGDNLITSPEQCEDGNQLDGDGCSSTCLFECVEGANNLCFLPSQVIVTQGEPLAIKSAQFNDDSHLDLAITTNTDKLEILLGNGGAFSPSLVLPTNINPTSLDIGDSNNDGATDVVVAAHDDGRLNVFFGDGLGSFPVQINLLTQDAPSALIFADLNNDLLADVITTCETSGTINTFLAQPNDTFSGAISDGSPGGPSSIAAGLLNGDGFLDVVSANFADKGLHLFFGNAQGQLNSIAVVSTNSVLEALVIADVNLDSNPDFISAASDLSQVLVQLRDGVGGFLAQQNIPLAGTVFGHHTLLAQDINSDSFVDLIVQTTNLQAQIFLGDGTGAFFLSASLAVDGKAITAGDFNNDGKVDLVIAEKNQPQVRLFLQQP